MAANKSGENQKSPPSEMIRVPVPLIGVVRQLSKLHRQGHTIALLQALEELISKFDSNIDIDVAAGSKSVLQLEERLSKLESGTSGSEDSKLEALALAQRAQSAQLSEGIAKKLEQIERTMQDRQGHTIALLQALEELISKFDSNIDIDVAAGSKSVLQLEERLSKLESGTSGSEDSKLEAIAKKLEQIERAIASGRLGNNKPRSRAYPYQQPSVELQPFPNENLAQRLGVSPQSLIVERENKSTQEFISWSRNRDPMSVGWEWNARDGLYHPRR